jgi:nucleotide-binding universal stress UspA family protein
MSVYIAAIDSTDSAAHVVEVAAGVARALGPAELHIIHVLAHPAQSHALDSGRALLDEHCAKAQKLFDGTVIGHLAAGEPWQEILQRAADLDADLVVVGTTDRRGLKRLVLGSVAERVTRRAQCPVLVARTKDYHTRLDSQIAPACPECLATQRETDRRELWCAKHAATHPKPHQHYELPEGYGAGSMFIRP